MAIVNHAKKEINAKLVYYGPAGGGKSTALRYIYSRIKPSLRGELKNIPAGRDSLLFFDFSPFEAPMASGYRLRLHVYTMTGLVTNQATWKMTLKGADGLVIMAVPDNVPHALESVIELRKLLSGYGISIQDIPTILQLNFFEKEAFTTDTSQITLELGLPRLKACLSNVATGEGVLDVLTALSKLVLERVPETGNRIAPVALANNITITDDYNEQEESGVSDSVGVGCAFAPAPAAAVPVQVEELPQISIASEDATVEGTVLRIPIDMAYGDVHRRLVITVSVDSL